MIISSVLASDQGASDNKVLLSLYSATQTDKVAGTVLSMLDQYDIALDTQSYPANLYAESLLYMLYWFHRLRDPARKMGMQEAISQYLNVDSKAAVVNALLSSPELKIEAKQRIDDGVMIRRTVDVLVIREGELGRQFLTLDRSTFPLGMSLPGGLVRDDDEQNELGIPGNIFAALRVAGSKVLGSVNPEYGIGCV